jgi:hypothetical protein
MPQMIVMRQARVPANAPGKNAGADIILAQDGVGSKFFSPYLFLYFYIFIFLYFYIFIFL